MSDARPWWGTRMSNVPCRHCGTPGFLRRETVTTGYYSVIHVFCGKCQREWKEPDPRAMSREVTAHLRRKAKERAR